MSIFEKFKKRSLKDAPPSKVRTPSIPPSSVRPEAAVAQADAPTVRSAVAARPLQKDTILAPVVTEKATHGEARGTYTFLVHPRATKIQITHAIRERYGVVPTKVRVIWTEGKIIRFGGRGGRRSLWKKAMVTVPKGTTLSIHEGV